FTGVLTVVLKLLAIVSPAVLVLGQKDAQQALLIRAMCEDLNLGTSVVVVPTVRDADGLALSSRNAYLSAEERRSALCLPRALESMSAAYSAGERDAARLAAIGEEILSSDGDVRLEYLAIASALSLEPVTDRASPGDVVLAAARVGGTRLIDNLILWAR